MKNVIELGAEVPVTEAALPRQWFWRIEDVHVIIRHSCLCQCSRLYFTARHWTQTLNQSSKAMT